MPEKRRKFAIDCDGVLFDFNTAYMELITELHGVTLPPVSATYPNEWDYSLRHITKAQDRAVWNEICGRRSYEFWANLRPFWYAKEFLAAAQTKGPLVFITSRCGKHCKQATEDALKNLGVESPVVIVAHNKSPVLRDEQVTDFLDDRDKNFTDSLNCGYCWWKLWMLDQPWNRHFHNAWVTRIEDPKEMLTYGNKDN